MTPDASRLPFLLEEGANGRWKVNRVSFASLETNVV